MNFFKKLLKNFLVDCGSAYVLHSDKKLISLYVNKRDECAFDVLIDRYLERIYSLVFRVTKDHQNTEDVVQEIFITLSNKLQTFRGDSSFSTWLYRISLNAALMKIRADKKYFAEQSLDEPKVYDNSGMIVPRFVASDWSNRPDIYLFRKEALEILNKAIQELPESYRSVIHLKDIEGFLYSEISDVLGISVQAVKSRIHRARLILRDKTANYYDEWRKNR